MIQVCSGCGTRWNVRDKQRMWCPRCQAALLAPSPDQPAADPRWGPAAAPQGAARGEPAVATWISVDRRAPRGRADAAAPSPRADPDTALPGQSGLGSQRLPRPDATRRSRRFRPDRRPVLVRSTLRAHRVVLAAAAVVHAVRYILLVINRDTLLHPVVAGSGALARRRRQRGGIGRGDRLCDRAHPVAHRTSRGRLRALPARRSATVRCAVGGLPDTAGQPRVGPGARHRDRDRSRGSTADCESRSPCGGRCGCSAPLLSIFAIATSFTTDAQGIADNTVTTTLAYLLAFAVVLALTRVYEGFVRKPVDRPAHRWVVVGSEQAADPPTPESPAGGRAGRPGTGGIALWAHPTRCTADTPSSSLTGGRRPPRPEHTLAAYELALQEGADGVECDVRLTRDGHLVCVHDRRIDRTSTGTGLVSEMTLAQLRRLDYGAWHSGGRRRTVGERACSRSTNSSGSCSTGTGRSRSSSRPSIRCATAHWWRARCWRCCTATGSRRRRRQTCPVPW